MSKFVIEKAVPLPKRKVSEDHRKLLTKMEPGDSFFVPQRDQKEGNRIRAAARYHNIKLAIRAEGDGMRVWRLT